MRQVKAFVEENKNALIAIVIALIIFFSGFSSKMYQVKMCSPTVSKYVTAEYSEITTGIDSEGHPTTSTDYWSEPASEVYTITKHDEMPEYPPMPPHDTSMSSDYNFDNFQFHTDAEVSVYAEIPEETTTFSVAIYKAKACLDKLDTVVIVSTWYTITYDSDF